MHRIDKVRKYLEDADLDAFLVTNVKNIYYLTGFQDISTANLVMLIPASGEPTLLLTPLSREAAALQAKGCQMKVTALGEPIVEMLLLELKATNLKRLGFDDLQLQTYKRLTTDMPGTELLQKNEAITNLRKIKDEKEISCIRRASELTDAGMEAALEAIRPGAKEYEIAGQAEYAMRMAGSMGVAFETIVASGPRSAFPHGLSSDREIREGDLVTVDLGATWRGYCSDLTRTIVAGKASRKDVRLLHRVKEAHDRVLEEICPGVNASKIDATARAVLGRTLSSYFIHGLGHGVGLDVHEAPTLSRTSGEVLEIGNVVTDEPGVYISGHGGVRTEDTVLVTKKGCEKLTKASYR